MRGWSIDFKLNLMLIPFCPGRHSISSIVRHHNSQFFHSDSLRGRLRWVSPFSIII